MDGIINFAQRSTDPSAPSSGRGLLYALTTGVLQFLLPDGTIQRLGDWSRVNTVSVTGAVAIAASALGKLHVCSGTTANYTITLPAAASCSGRTLHFQMATGLTKLVTLDGNASETIDGALTRVLWAGESAVLWCDGSNWFKVAGRAIPMTGKLIASASQSIANTTSTKLTLAASEFDDALLCDTTNSKLTIRRDGIYKLTGQSMMGFGTAVATATNFTTEVRKNTTNLIAKTLSAPAAIDHYHSVGLPIKCVAGDFFDIAVYQNSGGAVSTIYSAGVQICALAATEACAW